jgi:hypothetical protein
MAIKVSTLLAHNTDLVLDAAPTLGGDLDTNGDKSECDVKTDDQCSVSK